MKLAVFSRSLSRKPTGRGFLVREIVEVLLRSARPPEIELFCAEDLGLPGARYHPARGVGRLSDAWRVFRGIASDVRRLQPDVFWATTHFLPLGLPSGLPRVVTLLDLVWKDHPETLSGANRRAAGWLERGLRKADRIACISQFTRDRLAVHFPELAGRAEVVRLAPNSRLASLGLDPTLLERKHGIRGPFLLNVDTFEPRKNLRVVLDVLKRMPELLFVQCGHRGWNVDADWAEARSLPNVRLLEYVDEESLAALYRGARACIFPTIYEGFHLPPLDALALGAPVLASDIPVHREILGDAAIYFPAGDARRLEELLRGEASDERLRERRGEAGRARAAGFRWEDAAEGMLRIFESVG